MADSLAAPYPPPAHAFRTLRHKAGSWYPVRPFDATTGNFAPAAFNGSGLGNARFSPLVDPASGKTNCTLYAANERGAIAEIVLRDVPNPSIGYLHDLQRDHQAGLHLSRIQVAELRLVNLTTMGLQAAGLQPADLFFAGAKPDYSRTRAWALWIWQNVPQAKGLRWVSRRDNQCEAIMLFGDRVALVRSSTADSANPCMSMRRW